ncbi:MAG: site-2 protease family protein [bacterium]|nr:site-2 protease family protein [bacterium]
METTILYLVILIFSVVIHEVSHGLVAEKFGDPTAKWAGRLTLNPLPHIDLFSSILLPAFLIFAGSPIIFGAAKPVPVNYANLRHPKRDMALVALAGPCSNFLLALLCAVPIRLGILPTGSLGEQFLVQAVLVNLVLGIFNLIPIPPLDGSKVLAAVISERFLPLLFSWERYGFLIIIVFLYAGVLDWLLVPLLKFSFNLLIGSSLF